MNKYIRTKSGKIIIYDDNSKDIDKPMILYYKSEIVKVVDTIVELCDYAFVFDNDEITIGKIIHENDEQFTQWLKGRIELGMKVKLAILTDKGLIYVAETNDKGELCLI